MTEQSTLEWMEYKSRFCAVTGYGTYWIEANQSGSGYQLTCGYNPYCEVFTSIQDAQLYAQQIHNHPADCKVCFGLSDVEQMPYQADTHVRLTNLLRSYEKMLTGDNLPKRVAVQTADLRKLIEAAHPYLSSPCAVEVVKLDWQEPTKETNGCWTAKCLIGTYSVVNENGWYAVLDEHAFGVEGFEWSSTDLSKDTRQTAYAAAQADFEHRILANVVTKRVDVASWAQYLLAEWDQQYSCRQRDDVAKALSDKLILAACFAGVAYDAAMSLPIMVDKAPEFLLRIFLIALVDQNSSELDPYRAKNRSQPAILTNEGTKPVDVAAVRKQAFEEAARLAETRYKYWGNPARHNEVVCAVTACEEIAAAIRALTHAEPAQGDQSGITISSLQAAHIERQREWCPDQQPDLSFRGNEMAGEVGEACNVIKKLERERQGWRGTRSSKEELASELADVIHTAILCAVTAGIDLEAATVEKFNATSDKNDLRTRLPAAPTSEAGK